MHDEIARLGDLRARAAVRARRRLLPLLALALLMVPAPAAAGPPVFTGDVAADFDPADAGVLVVPDPGGVDAPIPSPPFTGPAGFDIEDVRFYYDRDTDILYVGINTYVIAGDADNDGDPGGTSPALEERDGNDAASFGGTESFGLVLDTGGDGEADVILGVGCFHDIVSFGAYSFFGILEVPFCSFGSPLPAQSGITTDPNASAPDLEFTVPSFSGLPGLPHDPRTHPFTLGVCAFLGSLEDADIGEDYVPSQGALQNIRFPYEALVAGRAFHDLNENGLRDGGEPALSGLDVRLDAEMSGGGSVSDSFTSIGSGQYGFFVDVPVLETATATLTLAPGVLDAWAPTTDHPLVVTGVAPGDVLAGNHFGLVVAPARLRGEVFIDEDGSGDRDPGEPGVEGIEVAADVTIGGNTSQHALLTDANGAWLLEIDLASGETADCVVSVDDTAIEGAQPTTPVILERSGVGPSEQVAGLDFGFQYPSFEIVVSGRLFVDPDGDGHADGDVDGMGGIRVFVEVEIPGLSPALHEVVTGGDGRYSLSVPIDAEQTADLLVRVSEEELPGVRFTTAKSASMSGALPEAVFEDVDFGFRPHRIPVVGDWDGDGDKTIALFETSTATFYFRNDHRDGPAEMAFQFGESDDVPIAGDWDGDGRDSIGVYRPRSNRFRLKNELAAGRPDHNFKFGNVRMDPIAGDWDGDGVDTIGLFNPPQKEYFLKNEHRGGIPDLRYHFGQRHAVPISGDWNRDGIDTMGQYLPDRRTFILRDEHAPGVADRRFRFGDRPHLSPLAGDWNGNDKDTVGVYYPADDLFELRNFLSAGIAHEAFEFTTNHWIPVYGDWDGDGEETPGAYDPARALWLLRNSNRSGGEEIRFEFGEPNRIPVAGDWNGDGRHSIGVYVREESEFRLRDVPGPGEPSHVVRFARETRFPLIGDWDGNGTDTFGIYDEDLGKFLLTDSVDGGSPEYRVPFDVPGRIPVVGDWNGDGRDAIGTFDPEARRYRLRHTVSQGPPDDDFVFGDTALSPLAADFDGDGRTTVGGYRASAGKHLQRDENRGGGTDTLLTFPIPFW